MGQAAAVATVILGAAGRDFHNFNVLSRGDPATVGVAFTATQIPGSAGRRYPAELAGPHYPAGIPIHDESELESICRARSVGRVMFAYSDVPHEHVMHLASRVLAAGADFVLAGPDATMLRARRPVVAISAIRTGCGKSQVSRFVAGRLRAVGLRVAVLRHPMPYGDLTRQAVQRFAARADLDRAECTIEEREEFEPHLEMGSIVYAGVDYARILAAAESEAGVLVWDGGNNDFPFIRPDLHIVLADALRPGQATTHHPGEAVLRMADAIIIAKADSATPADVERVRSEVAAVNPRAPVLRGASPVRLDDPDAVRGRRVLIVEDGPTLTHGGMPSGAGLVAVRALGDSTVVDPHSSAAPEMAAVYAAYPHIGPVLPAVGYDPAQLAALAATIDRAQPDVVVAATPVDLGRLIRTVAPIVRARYEFADVDHPGLAAIVDRFAAMALRGG